MHAPRPVTKEAPMNRTLAKFHAWVLRCGICALAIASAAPSPAASLRGGPSAPRQEAARDAAEDEPVPTWAPATLIGDVLVKSDGQGRLAVIVDGTSRGAATRMFLLTPAVPLADPIEVRLGLASVVFRGDSLFVSAPSHRFTVDIALASGSDGRREIQPDGIVLHDGLALQSLRFSGAPTPLEDVRVDERPSVFGEDGGAVLAGACQAGGPGASTCTKKCSLGLAGASFIDECSVTCVTGHYACCNCIVPREGATCNCVKEEFVGPIQPGVRMDGP
jgi:hypothetical protein